MFGCAVHHLDVRPLTDAVGAQIRGLDVAGDPEPPTIVAIRTAFSRHEVVLFRDQSLDAPGLAAFSRRLGRLAHSGNQRYAAPDAADVMLVGDLVVDGEWRSMFTNGMEDWHVDHVYKQMPNTGTLLYAVEVVANARRLGDVLMDRGLDLVGGGTDTHMVLVDLSGTGATGQEAEDALTRAGITSNKNPIPFDAPRPSQWRGLRLGVSAVTTRGFGTAQMEALGLCIADLILAGAGPHRDAAVRTARETAAMLTREPGGDR